MFKLADKVRQSPADISEFLNNIGVVIKGSAANVEQMICEGIEKAICTSQIAC